MNYNELVNYQYVAIFGDFTIVFFNEFNEDTKKFIDANCAIMMLGNVVYDSTYKNLTISGRLYKKYYVEYKEITDDFEPLAGDIVEKREYVFFGRKFKCVVGTFLSKEYVRNKFIIPEDSISIIRCID